MPVIGVGFNYTDVVPQPLERDDAISPLLVKCLDASRICGNCVVMTHHNTSFTLPSTHSFLVDRVPDGFPNPMGALYGPRKIILVLGRCVLISRARVPRALLFVT